MKINILGTQYQLRYEQATDAEKIKNSNGYIEPYSKEMVISNFIEDGTAINNLEDFEKKVIRHEIIHAFLQESGLSCNSDWATNEEMIDWIALQFPKLAKAFEEAKAI